MGPFQPHLPRSPDAFEKGWHPHGQHNSFFQQLLGVFQVCNVVPEEDKRINGSVQESQAFTSTCNRPTGERPHPVPLQVAPPTAQLALLRVDKHVPFHVGILRNDVSLQSFHEIFIIARPVVFLQFFLLGVSFALEGKQGSISSGFSTNTTWHHSRLNKQASWTLLVFYFLFFLKTGTQESVRITLSSLDLPPGSFPSLWSFFSLALGGLFLSPLGPRGEFLCWALAAMLSRLLGGLLSLTGWERRLAGKGECLQTQN